MPRVSTAGTVYVSTRYFSTILILISTAIPFGFRPPHLSLAVIPNDLCMNIALYLPFGLAFAGDGFRSVLWRSSVLSTLVEIAQLFFFGRFSQPSDILANIIGGLIGVALVSPSFRFARLRLNWVVSLFSLTAAAVWTLLCPAFSGDYRWLIQPPRWVLDQLDQSAPGIDSVRGLFVLVHAGPPANAAFLTLLIITGLTGLPKLESTLRSAIGACIAAFLACLLLVPVRQGFYPLCVLTALATSVSFTLVNFWNAEHRTVRHMFKTDPYEGGALLEPSPDDGS